MVGFAQFGRAGLFVALIFLDCFSPQLAGAGKPDAVNIGDFVRRAVANYKARQAQSEKYTYLARIVRTEFDQKGKAKGHIIGTYEIMFLQEMPYRRLIRTNDQPLSPEQEKTEQQYLEAEAKIRKAGGNRQPDSTIFTVPIEQLTEGFRLRGRGRRFLNGREVQVIEAIPDDRYRPATPAQDYARHFQMKLWINAEAQIVRVESRVVGESVAIDQDWIQFSQGSSSQDVETFSQNHRAEIARGSVSETEWTKVNDEAWLPTRNYWKTKKMTVTFSSAARPMSFPVEITSSYSNYQKFRVDTRIVPE